MSDARIKVENQSIPVTILPRTEKALIASSIAVFALSLALYAVTLAPTVTLVDSGELIVAAQGLGVAHPPGFPLYVLLAHIATLVPVGNVAERVNFASALFAALASAMITLVLAEMLFTPSKNERGETRAKRQAGRKGRRKRSVKSAFEETVSPRNPLHVFVPALVAGLLLAFSRTLWSYATIAEVYTLNTLLILIIFFLMFRWRRKIVEAETIRIVGTRLPSGGDTGDNIQAETLPVKPRAFENRDRLLYIAAAVFGLALGVHHVSVALMLPAFAALVLFTEGLKFFASKRLLYAALFAFAGLAIYVYLPIAASRSPVMNWGNPETLERLWWHVTGRQYQVFFSFSASRMGNQLGEFFRLVGREFGPWWLPLGLLLAAAGVVRLFRRDRVIFWFLALVFAADLAYALNYEIAEDKDAYYLPAFLALAIAAGYGALWLIRAAGSARPPVNILGGRGAVAVLLVPAVAFATNLPYNNRSQYYIAHDYVENIMSTIEPQGMLLTLDWQVHSPMLYTREVEDFRPDVVTIDVNLLRRSWYFDYLERAYPEVMAGSRDKVDAYLEDLLNWEQNPEAYINPALNQRINSRFYDMITTFVSRHIEHAPVYITQDIATASGPDSELTTALSNKYQLVPQGLVFQLFEDRQFHQPASPDLATRGLNDGTIRFEGDDVVRQKVLPVYLNMLTNRGRYLAAFNQHQQAIEACKRALEIDPHYSYAERQMEASANALRNAGSNKP